MPLESFSTLKCNSLKYFICICVCMRVYIYVYILIQDLGLSVPSNISSNLFIICLFLWYMQ